MAWGWSAVLCGGGQLTFLNMPVALCLIIEVIALFDYLSFKCQYTINSVTCSFFRISYTEFTMIRLKHVPKLSLCLL